MSIVKLEEMKVILILICLSNSLKNSTQLLANNKIKEGGKSKKFIIYMWKCRSLENFSTDWISCAGDSFTLIC